jgi:hypothetical protein
MSIDPVASRLSAEGVAYAPQIAAAARRYGLDPNLLAAVAAQETGGPGSNAGRNIVGDGGHGHGIFQIDDRWHTFASTAGAMDPGRNADYAAGMLSGLFKEYGGNAHEALSAYNSGSPTSEGTATQWGDGSRLGYADSVLRHYQRLTGASPATSPESAQATAIAETPTAVENAGALQSVAQRFPPLPAPSLPGLGHAAHTYHRQATDYLSLTDGDNDASDSS